MTMRSMRRPSVTRGTWMGRRRMARVVSTGILVLAMLPLLTACPQASEQSHVIHVTGRNIFEPTTLTVARGSTVVWQNGSTGPQTVTCDPAKAAAGTRVQLPAGASPWDSGDLYAGEVWRHTFAMPGTYTYFSRYDAGGSTVGTITVRA